MGSTSGCKLAEIAIRQAVGISEAGTGTAIGGIASIPPAGAAGEFTIPLGAFIGYVSTTATCKLTLDMEGETRCKTEGCGVSQ